MLYMLFANSLLSVHCIRVHDLWLTSHESNKRVYALTICCISIIFSVCFLGHLCVSSCPDIFHSLAS